ncbi:MAG: phage portal protein, partial [Gammaproteobacteria bacterium]|nr:phage portal protein [Gammaproteobacteria bacterium]
MSTLSQRVFKTVSNIAFNVIGSTPTQRQTKSRSQRGPMAFNFGDPEPVLGNIITNYLGVFSDSGSDYYNPPVSLQGLANIKSANAHHETALHFKRNMILKWYNDNTLLPRKEFGPAVFDRFVFGNCYFQKIYNAFDQVVQLRHLPAMYMRKMKEAKQYCQLQSNGADKIVYKIDEVIHLKDYDIKQQIYGMPEYIGGIQSILLNESATLFRRKYYENGAHMGYIFYTADADFEDEDEKALKEQIANSKGAGNFRSMFLNIPGGKPDSVKIIPVG